MVPLYQLIQNNKSDPRYQRLAQLAQVLSRNHVSLGECDASGRALTDLNIEIVFKALYGVSVGAYPFGRTRGGSTYQQYVCMLSESECAAVLDDVKRDGGNLGPLEEIVGNSLVWSTGKMVVENKQEIVARVDAEKTRLDEIARKKMSDEDEARNKELAAVELEKRRAKQVLLDDTARKDKELAEYEAKRQREREQEETPEFKLKIAYAQARFESASTNLPELISAATNLLSAMQAAKVDDAKKLQVVLQNTAQYGEPELRGYLQNVLRAPTNVSSITIPDTKIEVARKRAGAASKSDNVVELLESIRIISLILIEDIATRNFFNNMKISEYVEIDLRNYLKAILYYLSTNPTELYALKIPQKKEEILLAQETEEQQQEDARRLQLDKVENQRLIAENKRQKEEAQLQRKQLEDVNAKSAKSGPMTRARANKAGALETPGGPNYKPGEAGTAPSAETERKKKEIEAKVIEEQNERIRNKFQLYHRRFVRNINNSEKIEQWTNLLDKYNENPTNQNYQDDVEKFIEKNPINMDIRSALYVSRCALENIEHDTAYSSPNGFNYEAIQSDLLPPIALAYNQNADAIARSPRLTKALQPLTVNGGQLDFPPDVAGQIRYLHWLSVAADVLRSITAGEEVDELQRTRCILERPIGFL